MHYSKQELKDLTRALVILSLAFAIAFKGLNNLAALPLAFLVSLLTAGSGFIFHELAHKYVAQKLGYYSEFRANNSALIMCLIFSFFGFIFAAPGGVMMRRQPSKRGIGLISAAGPLVNVILAILFLGLYFGTTNILQKFAFYGFGINSFLAFFNMLPFVAFDGAKVFKSNKLLFALIIIPAAALTFAAFILWGTIK
ncbi:hypothetical protein B6U93_01170 [Candidatus Woesearchaeota archaeon ex4484_78]|nr:MAG: hypothetical protein B6U93_01170 [Candidatus Woesearchaeota archaeon ex4484_78]